MPSYLTLTLTLTLTLIDEAHRAFTDAVQLSPTAISLYNLAGSYLDRGQLHEAISKYLEASRLDPQDAYVFNNLGLAYDEMGVHTKKQAIQAYQRTISLQPAYAQAYVK